MNFKHELGSKAKSKVYGMSGVLTSRSESLYGCNRYYVQPPVGKDNKIVDGCWFDEDDIQIIKAPTEPRKPKTTGGPASRHY